MSRTDGHIGTCGIQSRRTRSRVEVLPCEWHIVQCKRGVGVRHAPKAIPAWMGVTVTGFSGGEAGICCPRTEVHVMSEHRFSKGNIRKLWPTEIEKFRDHLLRLSKVDCC